MTDLDEQINWIEEELIRDKSWTESFNKAIGINHPSTDEPILEAILESLHRLKGLEK